ncbi:MAG: fructosamine kinase family protein [Bacteroidota bacterium]
MTSDFLQRALKRHLSSDIKVIQNSHVSGGCINTTLKVDTNEGPFFIKLNTEKEKALFEKEAMGLRLLKNQSPVEIPKVLGSGTLEGKVYLILEWIERGPTADFFWDRFGQQLAAQHRQTSTHFGLDHDNHIGRLPQSNKVHAAWSDFFINERLMPQLKLAQKSNLVDSGLMDQFERLYTKLDDLIPHEAPALLHGDLWSGNFLCSTEGQPCIFDPAVHFGHRETELAFTTLFGGFEKAFYVTYQDFFSLESGFDDRIDLHNLYPLLVHVNLFGPSYLSGIRHTLKRFV